MSPQGRDEALCSDQPPQNDRREADYPVPDRSGQVRSRTKAPEDPTADIGWDSGRLTDGRPYIVECWAEDQVTMLTYFFSTRGLESATDDDFRRLLVAEGLLRFTSSRQFVASRPWVDPSGNELWSVNVVVGDDNDTYVADNHRLRPYGTVEQSPAADDPVL